MAKFGAPVSSVMSHLTFTPFAGAGTSSAFTLV
jgi:hypothetical protein